MQGVDLKPSTHDRTAPGGFHVMLEGCNTCSSKGDKIPLTLTFEKAGSIEVMVDVEAMGARPTLIEGRRRNTQRPRVSCRLAADRGRRAASALACSSCGCSLSSDWSSQGIAPQAAVSVPTSGSTTSTRTNCARGRAPSIVVSRGPERSGDPAITINRNYTLGFDYSPTSTGA